jgi:sarcosine oxidase gamma subunit
MKNKEKEYKMKKQLFTLALLTAGYVANTQGMGTLALVYMTNINEKMAAGTRQNVNAVYARIKSETPKGHNKSVVRLEETTPGKWVIIAENPGTAAIILEKKVSGYSTDKKLNVCEHDITVTGTGRKNKNERNDEGIEVEEIEMDSEMRRDAIMRDVK